MRLGGESSAQGERRLLEGLALAESLAMRPLQAWCSSALGALDAGRGQAKEARNRFEQCLVLARQMKMQARAGEAQAGLDALR